MANPATPEQIVSVCDEVQHLIDDWAPGNLSERQIRAGSGSLRRLLVYNELHKVWNTLIGKEKFIIPASVLVIDDESLQKYFDLYTCSEVMHQGKTIYTTVVYTGKTKMTPIGDGKFKDEIVYGIHTEEVELSLNQYMQSICIIAGGKAITRNWVVQYVANSLGGSHFGPSSKKSQKFISAMERLKQFDVGAMPASVRELLGIGQAMCRADATNTLMTAYTEWTKKNPNIRIA